MPTQKIVSESESKMKKSIEALNHSLKSIRTGRASTGLVENLMVDYYGTPTPLKQMAALATPQADAIIIKPFDVSSLREVEKAIKNSDLSIAPVIEGKMIRLNIPPLSKERRLQLVTQIKSIAEQAKVGLRNVRRDSIKHLEKEEKDKTITEDDRDHGKKLIDDATKKYTSEMDDIVKDKSDEVMQD